MPVYTYTTLDGSVKLGISTIRADVFTVDVIGHGAGIGEARDGAADRLDCGPNSHDQAFAVERRLLPALLQLMPPCAST